MFATLGSNAAGLSYTFEDNMTDWNPRGSASIELSATQHNQGSKSLYISNRTSSWHGAYMQNDYLKAGSTYTFTVYVYTETAATIDLSLQLTLDGSASYPSVASKSVSANTWTELSGEYTIPEDATGIQAYIQSSTATLSFYIDDFTCEEKVEEEIDFSSQKSLKEAFKDYFKIGTAATANEITPQNTKNMILHHFNSLTPGNELKPDAMLDQTASQSSGNNVNPQVKLSSSTKTVLKFCEDNNMPMRGHVFVWHSQTPDWFFNENFASDGATVSKEIMNQRMENYIKNVVELVTTTYPNLDIYSWDIVNETFKNGEGVMRDAGSNYTTDGTSRWMEIYGDTSFIHKAFAYARKYVPSTCKLYYNDYNEYIASKRDGIYTLVKDLYDRGLCDGIGMQSHLSTSYPSVSLYKEAVQKYATIGCDIQVTELDITLADGATYDTQAQMYKDLFDIYREYKDNISLVAFWGTNDENSWRSSGEPLIFANYEPKAAYYKILEGMETSTDAIAASKGITVSQDADNLSIVCDGKFTYEIVNIIGQIKFRGTACNNTEIVVGNNAERILIVKVTTEDGIQKTYKLVRK